MINNILISIGLFSLFSIALYGFAGIPLWAPTHGPEDARGVILFLLHFMGIFALIAGFIMKSEKQNY